MNSAVALMIIMLLTSHVSSLPIDKFAKNTPRHFCESQLANVLTLTCQQGYNFQLVNDSEDYQFNDDVTIPSHQPIVKACCETIKCTPELLKSICLLMQINATHYI